MKNENNKSDNNKHNNSTNLHIDDNLSNAILQRYCEQLLEKTLEDSMKSCIATMAVQIQAIIAVSNYFIKNHININNTSETIVNQTELEYKAREENTTDCTGTKSNNVCNFIATDCDIAITKEEHTTNIIGTHNELNNSNEYI